MKKKRSKQSEKVEKTIKNKRTSIETKKEEADLKFTTIFNKILNNWGLLLLLGIVIGLLTYVFRDFLWQKYVYLFKDIGSDTLNIVYPNQISHGENTSRWSFYEGMGRATGGISNIFQTYSYYPWWWLQKPFTWLSQYNNWSTLPHNMVFNELKYIVMTGFFAFLYLRSFSLKGFSALIGSLMFTFSGYVILGSSWYHGYYALLFIFTLFAFEQLFKRNNWLFMPYAFFLLNSYLYYLYGLFLILYSIFRYFDENSFNVRDYKAYKGLVILWLKVGALGIVGIGLSATSSISAIYNVLNTPRGSGGSASYVEPLSAFPIFGLEKSIHYISAIMRTFSSDMLGNGSFFRGWRNYLEDPVFYCGLITLLLIPQVFIHLKKRRKIVYGVFLGIWIIMIIFPFFRYAYYKFVGDYYKQAIDLIVPLVFILYAVYALNFIIAKRKKINIIVLVATLLVFLAALYYPYFRNTQNYVEPHLQSTVRNFLILYAVILVGLNYPKVKLFSQIAIIIALIFELGYFSFQTVNNRQSVTTTEMNQRIGYNDYTKEAIQYLKANDSNFYRLEKDYSSGIAMHRSINDAKVQNFYGTSNYSSFNQLNYIRFLQKVKIIEENNEIATRWAPGFKTRPLLMNMASVKYILSKQKNPEYQKFGYYPVWDSLGIKILKNQFFIPLGYTYDKYTSMSDFEKMPNTTMMDIAILKSCIISDNESYYAKYSSKLQQLSPKELQVKYTWQNLAQDVAERKIDTLTITSFQHHHIKGTIKCNKPKVLFFSIPYDPGWTAKVDGKETPVEMVNIGFCGILLESGEHNVELEYILPGTDIAKTVTGIFFFIYLGLILYFIYYKRQFFIDKYNQLRSLSVLRNKKISKTYDN